jgi:hypothetical protein
MPAIITHNLYGREVLERNPRFYQGDKDCVDAFLLGNQGPDPLFFLILNPGRIPFRRLGSTMHSRRTTALLRAFFVSKEKPELAKDYPLLRAYAEGMLCHYLLDSTVHPFVFAQEHALCDAGVDGLTRADHHEVHARIEREFDEVMLYTRLGLTVASYEPGREALVLARKPLLLVSLLYTAVTESVYGMTIPNTLFLEAVNSYRFEQAVIHSSTGRKRSVAGQVERLLRRNSLFEEMSHVPVGRSESIFENRAHDVWHDPRTGTPSRQDFGQLYELAQERATAAFALLDDEVTATKIARITKDINFSGLDSED